MVLSELTAQQTVFADVRANSKKALFLEVAHRIASQVGVDDREIFAALLERERLGSTGMGRGVAIPHCRLPNVTAIHGVLARLETPIDFDAVDGEPVDLFFFLIAPENAGADHLRALARVSRALRDAGMRQRLRGASGAEALAAVLGEFDKQRAA